MNGDLNRIAKEEKTDKNSEYHGYADKYDFYFNHLRDKNIKMLEIGILKGSSIRMWDRYFSNAQINAIDINPDCKKHEKENVKIYICDQSNIDFLNKHFCDSEFDIIIDDGSHIPKHQIASFEFLFKKLKPSGLYVIEDLHTSYCLNPIFSKDGINFVDYLKDKVSDL
jgi:predicted O-methyltransferase YrrM